MTFNIIVLGMKLHRLKNNNKKKTRKDGVEDLASGIFYILFTSFILPV